MLTRFHFHFVSDETCQLCTVDTIEFMKPHLDIIVFILASPFVLVCFDYGQLQGLVRQLFWNVDVDNNSV